MEGFIQAFSLGFPIITPIIGSCVSIVIYYLIGGQFISSIIFTSFSLFNIAGSNLSVLPGMIGYS
jgi:hypothetical protein